MKIFYNLTLLTLKNKIERERDKVITLHQEVPSIIIRATEVIPREIRTTKPQIPLIAFKNNFLMIVKVKDISKTPLLLKKKEKKKRLPDFAWQRGKSLEL